MPRKMARSGRQTPFGLAEALMAVHTSYLSGGKAGKTRIFKPVRESSGESQLRSTGLKLRRTLGALDRP